MTVVIDYSSVWDCFNVVCNVGVNALCGMLISVVFDVAQFLSVNSYV